MGHLKVCPALKMHFNANNQSKFARATKKLSLPGLKALPFSERRKCVNFGTACSIFIQSLKSTLCIFLAC